MNDVNDRVNGFNTSFTYKFDIKHIFTRHVNDVNDLYDFVARGLFLIEFDF